jgi:hypothetical protein
MPAPPQEPVADPYVDVCRRFEHAGVRYVIVGVFGINLYAQKAGQFITTADCDILVPANHEVLSKALKLLIEAGYLLEAGGEPLPEVDDVLLKGILRARAAIRADRPDARIDLCIDIAGATFEELWQNHRTFDVENTPVRVGDIAALVASKTAADRPKDRLFLELHKETIEALLRKEGT